MKVLRVRVSNWKSFRFAADPPWIPAEASFGDVNVLIGENSSGKSNLGNALRLVLSESGTDYGQYSRPIRPSDFNERAAEIVINAEVLNDQGQLVSLTQRIPPLGNIPECAWPQIDERVKGRFLAVGPKRQLGNIGPYLATTRRSDGAKNYQVVQTAWESIRKAAQGYFGLQLAKSPPALPAQGALYLEATPDENGTPLLETGSGKVETLYFLLETLKLAGDYSVFLFEEPETHMHPRLQRMFMSFLAGTAKEAKLQFFITTHSAAFVDRSLAEFKDIKVFHVTNAGSTRVEEILPADAEALRRVIYDSLGHRASEVLQANGVVWVEGPSDRLYLNRWLELLCTKRPDLPKFQEGVHYLIVPYGGNVETHEFFEDAARAEDLIKATRVNPNRYVIMDRDAGTGTRWANKQRVVRELGEQATWITHENATVKGNSTIEGYLPVDLKRDSEGSKHSKTEFARKATPQLTVKVLDNFGLEASVLKVHQAIQAWNRI